VKYLLTVLTNGRSEYLERTLAAFEQFVTPKPAEIFVHVDGRHAAPRLLYDEMPWEVNHAPDPVGFTMATKDCMDRAAQSELDWFFHLEDDFVILRPVNLDHLAEVLDREPLVKQMALVRTPVGAEIEYGGYIAKDPGWYSRRGTLVEMDDGHDVCHLMAKWIATQRNFATNPALAPTSFPREHPYPSVALSEGVYGFEIREREPEALFGLWGWGEPWCAHIGVDRARGSHGY
jgi:hypothetical protein